MGNSDAHLKKLFSSLSIISAPSLQNEVVLQKFDHKQKQNILVLILSKLCNYMLNHLNASTPKCYT